MSWTPLGTPLGHYISPMLEVLGRFGAFLSDLGAILRLFWMTFERRTKIRNSDRAADPKMLQKPFGFSMFFESPIMRASGRHDIPRGLHIPKSLKNQLFSRFFEGRMMRATRRQEIPRRLHIPKCFKNQLIFLGFLKVT